MKRKRSGSGSLSRLIGAIAVLSALSSLTWAFEGLVELPDGTPAADATVSIVGKSGSERSDRQGRFRWAPDPALPFLVLVTLSGGEDQVPVRVTQLPTDGPVVIRVGTDKVETVRVTAQAAPHIESPPGNANSLLSRRDLEQRNPERLVDVLENVPGAGRVGGGHEAVPSIRGLARGRTLLLLDGARVTSERRAGPSASFLDPSWLEAVEISRGPGSVAYGSDAIGGVVLARSRRAPPGAPFELRAAATVGSGAPEAGGGIEASQGLDEGGWIIQGRYRTMGDWVSPSGEIPNSEATDYGAYARFDHEAGPGYFSVLLRSDLGRDVERPTSDSDVTRVSQPREDSHRLVVGYDLDPSSGGTRVAVQGFLGSYRLVTEQLEVATAIVSRSDVEARDYGLRVHATHPVNDVRVDFGLDLHGRFDLSATNAVGGFEEVAISDADGTDAAVYASADASLAPTVRFSGGLRAGRLATESEGGALGTRSTEDAAVTGYAALDWELARTWSFIGQIARGFREPSLSDRYFVGVTGRGFAIGNPDLTAETSLQADLAVRYRRGPIAVALSAYSYRIEDLVERYRSEADGNVYLFRNRGSSRLRGVELEAQLDLSSDTALQIGAQTCRGELDDGTSPDDVPADQVFVQLRSEVGSRGDLQVRAVLFGRDENPGPTELVTPGVFLMDVGGGWRFGRWGELRFVLRNLLDREYPSSADERATSAPGRAALLTWTGVFGTRGTLE